MGAACCVAARGSTMPSVTQAEMSELNVTYSPSWSFQLRNQVQLDLGNYRNSGSSFGELSDVGATRDKRTEDEPCSPSDCGSPMENSHSLRCCRADGAGILVGSSFSVEGPAEVSAALDPSNADHADLMLNICHPSPSKAHTSVSPYCFPSGLDQSRRVHGSPCYKFYKQASESRAPAFMSQNDSSEGRQSFMPSVCNSVSAGSRGGSSDGWSLRTFCELIASQKERQSVDSDNAGPVHGLITRTTNHPWTSSVARDSQSCGICLKLLTEFSVVAVLVCGHVYHAECLENMTPEAKKFDPSCPVCMSGNKSLCKGSGRVQKFEIESRLRNKISRIGVVDGDLDAVETFSGGMKEYSTSKVNATSRMRSSFGRPFLRRHFLVGGTKSSRINGFWMRNRRE